MPPQLHINRPPDIRISTFLSFMHALSSRYPVLFGIIDATDQKAAAFYLQSSLQISKSGCMEIYRELATHFGIPPNEFGCQKLARTDHTIGELHRQLVHEANAYERHEYRPYHS